MTETKVCRKCGGRDWTPSGRCRPCGKARRKYSARHGISSDTYAAMLSAQGGGCAICGGQPPRNGRRLHIDHDHTCCSGTSSCGKCVRALLCARCNSGLGMFRDNPTLLRGAIDYLSGPLFRPVQQDARERRKVVRFAGPKRQRPRKPTLEDIVGELAA